MNDASRLNGKQIAILAADGVEQAELSAALAALKGAGARTTLIALRRGRIRAMQVHESGELVKVDATVDTARAADHDDSESWAAQERRGGRARPARPSFP